MLRRFLGLFRKVSLQAWLWIGAEQRERERERDKNRSKSAQMIKKLGNI